MYQVLIDDLVLYDPTLNGFELFSPKVQLEVNKVGRFDFKIYPNHPRYNAINKLKSNVEVYQNGVLIFRGRPLDDEIDFDNGKRVLCESDLAYFNDTIIRPYSFNGSIEEFMGLIIDSHNEQVEVNKQFTLGTVTVTDPNNYIVRADNEYSKSLDVITTKLVNMLGGYIVIRRVGDINYIDYLDDSEHISDQVIALGDNMLDMNKTHKGSVICTAIIPTGATIENENPDEEDYVVDITTVNGGIDYVFNQAAVDRWGWIFKHVSYSDITLPQNLKLRAELELGSMVSFIENIEITAIDKSMIDIEFHRFRIFEYVRVVSEPHNLDEFYLIKRQTINLTAPQNNTITIGAEKQTLTDSNVNVREEINVIRNETINNSAKISETYKNMTQTIEQTSEHYSREIKEELSSELEQVRSEISTEFAQSKDDFLFQFTQILEQVESIDDDTRVKFEQIVKYIRFIDGKIYLGELGNELELVISNDRISFMQGNTEVAYISNNKLNITDAQVNNSLQIGRFSFVPRSNGNMSLIMSESG